MPVPYTENMYLPPLGVVLRVIDHDGRHFEWELHRRHRTNFADQGLDWKVKASSKNTRRQILRNLRENSQKQPTKEKQWKLRKLWLET